MPTRTIFLSQATDAVDAALVTKDAAVRHYVAAHGLDLSEVAAIGDSEADLPFLTLPGLALAGCPANAQARVKHALSALPHGLVMAGDVFDGFEAFYDACAARGVRLIFSDKDGVLVSHNTVPTRPRLLALFAAMGQPGRPFVLVLTGSGEAQNTAFLAALRDTPGFLDNPAVRRERHLIHAECGAVQMDALTGHATVAPWLEAGDAADWMPALRDAVRRHIAVSVLDRFGLAWSTQRDDQDSKLFVPVKRTMVTVNVPRTHGGDADYRRSPASDALRTALVEAVAAAAHDLNVVCRRV